MHSIHATDVSPAKTAGPIEVLFGRGHRESSVSWISHWRHLVNTRMRLSDPCAAAMRFIATVTVATCRVNVAVIIIICSAVAMQVSK